MPRRAGGRGRPGGAVLARFVANLLAFAAKTGLNRARLMLGAGLTDAELRAPDSRVPFSKFVALWQLIARLSSPSDPEFGVRWGASLRVRDWGLLGYAMSYSETLASALRRLARYSPILADGLHLELQPSDSNHRVTVSVSDALPGAGLPYPVVGRLAALVAACREITGVDVIPSEVTVAYPQPHITAEHRRFFRGSLRFDQPVSGVAFFERDLRLPVLRADETLAGYLSDHAVEVLRGLVAGTETRERVRTAIWALLSEGRPRLEAVAAVLRVSPRTLQRRLAEEGSSLHVEVEHIRKTMAIATLRDRSIPIDDVAFVLGYAEPSTFYRSFKRWTGKTPRQYRIAAA